MQYLNHSDLNIVTADKMAIRRPDLREVQFSFLTPPYVIRIVAF